jgi:hypothetical protein
VTEPYGIEMAATVFREISLAFAVYRTAQYIASEKVATLLSFLCSIVAIAVLLNQELFEVMLSYCVRRGKEVD